MIPFYEMRQHKLCENHHELPAKDWEDAVVGLNQTSQREDGDCFLAPAVRKRSRQGQSISSSTLIFQKLGKWTVPVQLFWQTS